MNIIQAAALGAFGGVMGTVAVVLWINNRQTDADPNAGLTEQINMLRSSLDARNDVAKNLTATDMLTVSCGADWMNTHGPMLCREMFCRLQTNGAGAAQSECEEIANVANSVAIFGVCNAENVDYNTCVDLVLRRK